MGTKITRSFVTVFVFLITQFAATRAQYGASIAVNTINLLDSYIPAAMQIIAHLTESMKYELSPPGAAATPTSTARPTSTHKPAIFAPNEPLGPENYSERTGEYQKYVERLIDPTSAKVRGAIAIDDEYPENLQELVGPEMAGLLNSLTQHDADLSSKTAEERAHAFSEKFDDSDFRFYLLKNKKTPPTRAYVTLLSLYDALSKEAKRMGYNQFHGYTPTILIELNKTSSGTAADQLKFVLEQIKARQETNDPMVKKKIQDLLEDLKKDNGYLNMAKIGRAHV